MASIQSLLAANHSKANTLRIINYIGQDADLFEELIALFIGMDAELSRRAAWVFSELAPRFPEVCYRHWPAMLALVSRKDVHDAVKRGFFRALQDMETPEDYLGDTVQLCFEQLMNRQAAIAIRVFAMTSLVNMAQQLPELKSEIRLLLEDELPFGSAGFVSRAKRELRRL